MAKLKIMYDHNVNQALVVPLSEKANVSMKELADLLDHLH